MKKDAENQSTRLSYVKVYLERVDALMRVIGPQIQHQKQEFDTILAHAERTLDTASKSQELIFDRMNQVGKNIEVDLERSKRLSDELRRFFLGIAQTGRALSRINNELLEMEQVLLRLMQTAQIIHTNRPSSNMPAQIAQLQESYMSVLQKHDIVQRQLHELVLIPRQLSSL